MSAASFPDALKGATSAKYVCTVSTENTCRKTCYFVNKPFVCFLGFYMAAFGYGDRHRNLRLFSSLQLYFYSGQGVQVKVPHLKIKRLREPPKKRANHV